MNNTRAVAINAFEKPWAYVVLTKPDVTFLVVITTVAGFYLGSTGPMDWVRLAHTLIGTLAGRWRHRRAKSIRRARHGRRNAPHRRAPSANRHPETH